MNFPESIKNIRQRSFLSQAEFAKEIGVAFSTVNRWEGAKARSNLAAMKSIKEFCLSHDIDFSSVEEAWFEFEINKNNLGGELNEQGYPDI